MKRGWLVNPARRERRDRAWTLTDSQVMSLIKRIDVLNEYTKLEPEFDKLIRCRDKALIALGWTFFKRAKEILNIKLGDVYYNDSELNVTFKVKKKRKGIKECPFCGERNGKNAKYCRSCGANIQAVEVIYIGEIIVVTKRKSMAFPFCPIFVEWIKKLEELNCKPEYYVFPPFHYASRSFLWNKHLTVQRFDQILQRLDSTLSSHMFRYGHTEKLLRSGYTPFDLKEIGDWSSPIMPTIYAERKGLTPSQTRFMKDIRTV